MTAALATGVLLALLGAPAGATYAGREGRLTFVRSNQIYTVASGGGKVTKLTTDGKNYRPKWSPDGKRIAYVNETAGGLKDVFVMSASGGQKIRVTQTGNITAAATWSPDGKTLAFGAGTCPPAYACYDSFLYTVPSTPPFSTPVQMQGWDNEPWSEPDPTDIHPIMVDRYLAWSPSGTRIAIFGHIDEHLRDTISMYYLKSGENQEWAAEGGECCRWTDWSDLSWAPSGALGYGEVYYREEPYLDTVTNIIYPGFASKEGDKSPAPSPTSAHMAFVNATSGKPDIYVATIKGTQRKIVVSDGYQPDWQPLR